MNLRIYDCHPIDSPEVKVFWDRVDPETLQRSLRQDGSEKRPSLRSSVSLEYKSKKGRLGQIQIYDYDPCR